MSSSKVATNKNEIVTDTGIVVADCPRSLITKSCHRPERNGHASSHQQDDNIIIPTSTNHEIRSQKLKDQDNNSNSNNNQTSIQIQVQAQNKQKKVKAKLQQQQQQQQQDVEMESELGFHHGRGESLLLIIYWYGCVIVTNQAAASNEITHLPS